LLKLTFLNFSQNFSENFKIESSLAGKPQNFRN